eukprot:PLAT7740.1.p1 GENE.PLAT7740.1~~PLAT7740.1.p1  ORF type:complete len:825 (-),score=545.22 PLAT7740.1:6-2480(-)
MRVFVHDLHSPLGRALAAAVVDSGEQLVGSVAAGQPTRVEGALDVLPVLAAADGGEEAVAARERLDAALLASDIVIWQALTDADGARAAVRLLKRDKEARRTFVAISSVLSWAKTAFTLEEDGDGSEAGGGDDWLPAGGLQESAFRSRRASAAFLDGKALEATVLAAANDALATVVVGAGILYGGGEQRLRGLFRRAWMLDEPLQLPQLRSGGKNLLPTVHVVDAARIALAAGRAAAAGDGDGAVADGDGAPAVPRYVLAVDHSRTTLRQLLTAISAEVGDGSLQLLSAEESEDVLLMQPAMATLANLHLAFDLSTAWQESIGGSWHAPAGLPAAARVVGDEFRAALDLRPLRLVVMGPPASGKTALAAQLARKFYLPHIKLGDVLQELLADGKDDGEEGGDDGKHGGGKDGDDGDDGDDGKHGDDGDDAPAASPLSKSAVRAALQASLDSSKERVKRADVRAIAAAVQWKLSQPLPRNKGWVLDGVPRSVGELLAVFAVPPEAGFTDAQLGMAHGSSSSSKGKGKKSKGKAAAAAEEEEAEADMLADLQLAGGLRPHGVILLRAEDELLQARVLAMDEEEVEGTHDTEEGLRRRLRRYKELCDDTLPLTPATLFERCLHTELLELEVTDSSVLSDLAERAADYAEGGGAPFNFHPTPEEAAAAAAAAEAKAAEAEAAMEAERKAGEEEEASDRARRDAADEARRIELQKQEAALLEARSQPLRNYLMRYVMPVLTKGLVDVCKVMPEDPVDYLAEFLFDHSADDVAASAASGVLSARTAAESGGDTAAASPATGDDDSSATAAAAAATAAATAAADGGGAREE